LWIPCNCKFKKIYNVNPIIDLAPMCKHSNPKVIPTTWNHDIIHKQIGQEGGIKEQPNTKFLESECIVKEIAMLFAFNFFSQGKLCFCYKQWKGIFGQIDMSHLLSQKKHMNNMHVYDIPNCTRKKTLGMKIVVCFTCFKAIKKIKGHRYFCDNKNATTNL
jgi:hypothetical protein